MLKTDSPPIQTPLARLCFRLPPDRIPEFETVYETQLVPLLEGHGLVASTESGRTTLEDVFSRLFELETPSGIIQVQEALQDDSAWQEALRNLGRAFGTADEDGLIQHSFKLYAAPAGSGKQAPEARGRGHWCSFDVSDGLGDGEVRAICQDREGCL